MTEFDLTCEDQQFASLYQFWVTHELDLYMSVLIIIFNNKTYILLYNIKYRSALQWFSPSTQVTIQNYNFKRGTLTIMRNNNNYNNTWNNVATIDTLFIRDQV